MKQNYVDVEYVITLKVPVESRTHPGAREEATALIENYLSFMRLDSAFEWFGTDTSNYVLRPGQCYTEEAPS